ncbi:MAG: stage III sporulation protein AE [Lachnospiraceae bacterium]|nr:stage III sporulation protein AE [Lachnospiraceae bacterium]
MEDERGKRERQRQRRIWRHWRSWGNGLEWRNRLERKKEQIPGTRQMKRYGPKENKVLGYHAVLLLCVLAFTMIPGNGKAYAFEPQVFSLKAADSEIFDSNALSIPGADLPDLGLDEIQRFLDQQQEGGQISFLGLMEDLVKGDLSGMTSRLISAFRNGIAAETSGSIRLLAQAAALGILGAVFAQAAAVFPSSRISETGFFITYLLTFTCLTASFFTSVDTAAAVVSNVLEFMKLLLPAFFLSVAFAGGSISGAALYSSIIGAVSGAEFLCQMVILPLIKIYVLLVLAGNLSKEEFVTRMTEGLESGIRWTLKTVSGVFLGLQMIQTMILPYADSVKRASVQKLVSAIPGVGAGAEAVIQVTVGSGVLLKNTIGGATAAVLAVLAAAPVAKLLFFLLLYRGAAALMEPVCDKRITACADGMGKAHSLLLHTVLAVVLLFAISIGIVCGATNAVYFGG